MKSCFFFFCAFPLVCLLCKFCSRDDSQYMQLPTNISFPTFKSDGLCLSIHFIVEVTCLEVSSGVLWQGLLLGGVSGRSRLCCALDVYKLPSKPLKQGRDHECCHSFQTRVLHLQAMLISFFHTFWMAGIMDCASECWKHPLFIGESS